MPSRYDMRYCLISAIACKLSKLSTNFQRYDHKVKLSSHELLNTTEAIMQTTWSEYCSWNELCLHCKVSNAKVRGYLKTARFLLIRM